MVYLRIFLNIPFARIDLAPSLDPLNISYPTIFSIYVPSLYCGLSIFENSTPSILILLPLSAANSKEGCVSCVGNL